MQVTHEPEEHIRTSYASVHLLQLKEIPFRIPFFVLQINSLSCRAFPPAPAQVLSRNPEQSSSTTKANIWCGIPVHYVNVSPSNHAMRLSSCAAKISLSCDRHLVTSTSCFPHVPRCSHIVSFVVSPPFSPEFWPTRQKNVFECMCE